MVETLCYKPKVAGSMPDEEKCIFFFNLPNHLETANQPRRNTKMVKEMEDKS
jgi:hypothetical protein